MNFSVFQEGRRGYLEGLANHYSKHVTAKYEDILTAIESVRKSKWTERHMRAVNAQTLGPASATTMRSHKSGIANQSLLPNSHSQTIYVPGKYLVSSLIKTMFIFVTFLTCFHSFIHFVANELLIESRRE